jgi:hypothetical protein
LLCTAMFTEGRIGVASCVQELVGMASCVQELGPVWVRLGYESGVVLSHIGLVMSYPIC